MINNNMYATQVFLYTARQVVVLANPTSPRFWMPQYAKPLTLHKGVDNTIQFQFLSQNQQVSNMTNKDAICRVISGDGTRLLLEKTLTPVYALTGIMSLSVGSADLDLIDSQKAFYSIEVSNGPAFVDQLSGVRGDMNIVDSVLPKFVASDIITIPTSQLLPTTIITNGATSAQACEILANQNIPITYYSSVITTNDISFITLQCYYSNYTGDVIVEGSTLPDGDWYNALPVRQYTNSSITDYYNVEGYHPYLRFKFISTNGAATKILAR